MNGIGEMFGHISLGIISFSGGLIIAFGLVALIMGLNLIPRFAGVTRTAQHLRLYEKCLMAGAILGNLVTVYSVSLFADGSIVSRLLACSIGFFGGIYLGSWIIALTEVIDMFPILSRKTNIRVGIGWIVLSTAIGKSLFSLLYYFRGW